MYSETEEVWKKQMPYLRVTLIQAMDNPAITISGAQEWPPYANQTIMKLTSFIFSLWLAQLLKGDC